MPCSQSSTVSALGQRVAASLRFRSSRSASGIAMREGGGGRHIVAPLCCAAAAIIHPTSRARPPVGPVRSARGRTQDAEQVAVVVRPHRDALEEEAVRVASPSGGSSGQSQCARWTTLEARVAGGRRLLRLACHQHPARGKAVVLQRADWVRISTAAKPPRLGQSEGERRQREVAVGHVDGDDTVGCQSLRVEGKGLAGSGDVRAPRRC